MIERSINLTYSHRVLFTRRAFCPENGMLRELLDPGEKESAKVLFFLDGGLAAANQDLIGEIGAFFETASPRLELAGDPIVLPGGEASKNDWSLVERIWEAVETRNLCRHSYIIAIGGGAVLDLVGFGAATAHRGIRHVRMPTTTLSQGDGGVGVKNGVNFFGKKNWVGSFSVPHAIVNDLAFLEHLPERDQRAGIIEAIKVALIRDRSFFEMIEKEVPALRRLDLPVLEEVVRKSAEHHVDHIASSGDPFELGSARPLDFGHWVAHKLEQVSQFAINHGEAVAIGIVVDLLYSVRIGLLPKEEADRIIKVISGVGFEIDADCLRARSEDGEWVILKGLDEFREHLGGELTITLVPEIGKKLEVHEMDREQILGALEDLKGRPAAAE